MNRTDPGVQVAAERRRLESRETRAKQAKSGGGGAGARSRGRGERKPGAMKALNMQRALSQVSYGHRVAVKSRLQAVDSFGGFPLLPAIQAAIQEEVLKGMADLTPTPIQRLAIPAMLGTVDKKGRAVRTETPPSSDMKQFLLAAETGSGKTLAYAIPVIDAIKRADLSSTHSSATTSTEPAPSTSSNRQNLFSLDPPPLTTDATSSAGRPRAIILVPTSELVDQVGSLFKSFSHAVKLRTALISAAYTAKVIRNRLFGPAGIDVLVSTPSLLSSIAGAEPNILARVTHLVIDEADSLLDRSFAPLTSALVDRAAPSLRQLILATATVPRALDATLRRRYPDMLRLATPNLHAVPRRVQLAVTDIDREPYRGNRDLACADAIWSIGREAAEHGAPGVKHVLVFVNEREKATQLAEYLATKGVDAAALNRDSAARSATDTLAAFTSGVRSPADGDAGAATASVTDSATRDASPRILRNVRVLVCTDLGSRGLDTLAVRHVVLHDVPHTTVDFLHRLGRTGRMGRRGRGVVLVGKDDRKDVVREVREGMFRGAALI